MQKSYFLDLCLLSLLLLLVFFKGSTIGDPGIGWHLKNGELIIATFEIPKVDSFLYSQTQVPWISDQWLSDAIFYLFLSIGGFSLLHLGCAVLQVVAYGVVIGREIFHEAPSRLASFFILMLTFTNGSLQWFCRPVLFSFLFFALFYKWMRNFCGASSLSTKDLILLHVKVFLLFGLWANLHPGFAVAAIIFATSIFEILISSINSKEKNFYRFYTIVSLGGVALLATLINPYGLELHQSILSLVASDYFMKLNVEWLPPDLSSSFFTPFFLSCGLIVLLLVLIPLRAFRHFDLFAVLVLLALAFLQRRYIPFFAIPLGLFLATSMSVIARGQGRIALQKVMLLRLIFRVEVREKGEARLVLSKAFVLGCLAFVLIFNHLPFRTEDELAFIDTFPKHAVTYLRQTSDDAPLFATPDWGGFLIWSLWPKYSVFIDDRNTLNGSQRYEDYFTLRDAKNGWRNLLNHYQFRYLLLKPEDKLAVEIQKLQNWHVVEEASGIAVLLFENVEHKVGVRKSLPVGQFPNR